MLFIFDIIQRDSGFEEESSETRVGHGVSEAYVAKYILLPFHFQQGCQGEEHRADGGTC